MPGPVTSSSSEPLRLGLITWDDDSPTGGNAYNNALVGALRSIGVAADIVRVGSGWPRPTATDLVVLRAALADRPVAVVDGIVAGAAPEEIRGAVRAGGRVSVLVHLPLADEVGLSPDAARSFRESERASLAAADTVFCPSHHTAARLATRYGRADALVARPGVDSAALATGSSPPHVLCLGALTPGKNQLALLAALGDVAELDWTASIVGSLTAAPGYADEVVRIAATLGPRLRVTGPLTGERLERVWSSTDLLVLCSRAETYGLVVAEALAHGIPAVVPSGTGAVEALAEVDGLPPGRTVDPDGLVPTLRAWLTDPELRDEWRRLARRRRRTLPTWRETADIVRAALL